MKFAGKARPRTQASIPVSNFYDARLQKRPPHATDARTRVVSGGVHVRKVPDRVEARIDAIRGRAHRSEKRTSVDELKQRGVRPNVEKEPTTSDLLRLSTQMSVHALNTPSASHVWLSIGSAVPAMRMPLPAVRLASD